MYKIESIFKLFSVQQKKQLFFLFLLVLFMSLLDTIGIASVMPIITLITDESAVNSNYFISAILEFINCYLEFDSSFALLFLIIISIIVISFSTILKAFVFSKIIYFIENSQHHLTQELMFKIIGKEYKFFIKNNSSHLSNTVLIQTNRFVGGIIRPFLFVTTHLITSLFISSFLFLINPLVACLSFISLFSVYSFFYFIIRSKLLEFGSQSLDSHRNLHKITSDIFRGIKLIKLLPENQSFYKDFRKYSFSYSTAQAKIQISNILPNLIIEGLIVVVLLTVFLVFLFISKLNPNSLLDEHLSLVAVYAFAVMRIRPALSQVLSSASIYRSSVASIKQVLHDFHDSSLDEKCVSEANSISFNSDITIDNLSYSYKDHDSFELSNINAKINFGKFYTIVGRTGSGKSTLLDLLLGILEPKTDSIFIDRTLLKHSNKKNWHRLLSYVPQETFLLDGSIAENIAFGVDPKCIDYDKISYVSKIALLNDFIENDLVDGYYSRIGESGVCLSGGQRQRIGIARALYCNPKLLVLDEATSALDPVTEQRIYSNLLALEESVTIIMVTHRIRNAFKSDSILFMEGGRLIFEGSYDDLYAKHDKFRAFVDLD